MQSWVRILIILDLTCRFGDFFLIAGLQDRNWLDSLVSNPDFVVGFLINLCILIYLSDAGVKEAFERRSTKQNPRVQGLCAKTRGRRAKASMVANLWAEVYLTITRRRLRLPRMRLANLCLVASLLFSYVVRAQTPAGVPVFEIIPVESKIKFDVKASVAIVGVFDKWEATLTFTSTDVSTGVVDIKIQAASVDTGSGMKDGKLKGQDFLDVEHNPVITFKSTKIVQTGPDTFEVDGDFTMRGVTKPEKLMLTVSGKGTGSGTIVGTMAFDRKDYGMNKGIPFVKIADRVEVDVRLKGTRVSGPPLALK